MKNVKCQSAVRHCLDDLISHTKKQVTKSSYHQESQARP